MCLLKISNIVLLGTYLATGALGAPHVPRQTSLDAWLTAQEPIALKGVLANIGSGGSKASGAADGIIVASPSKSDPDCTSELL